MNEALDRYATFFGRLQESDLARFDEVFAADARFKDPFNEVRGVPAIRAVFAHMYASCRAPRFTVLDVDGSDASGWIRWRFEFGARGIGDLSIEGASHVRFDAGGLAVEHIDYWDASELFEALPAVGRAVGWLRRRLGTRVSG